MAVEGPPFGRGEHAAHEVLEASVPAGPGAFAQAAVGRHEDLHAVRNDVLDLALVPVARVGEHDLRVAEPLPASSRRVAFHHRFEVAEVGSLDGDLGGDDDLVLVDRRLRVVALQRRLAVCGRPASRGR